MARYVSISKAGKITVKEPGGRVVAGGEKRISLQGAMGSARHANVSTGFGSKVRVVDNRKKSRRKRKKK